MPHTWCLSLGSHQMVILELALPSQRRRPLPRNVDAKTASNHSQVFLLSCFLTHFDSLERFGRIRFNAYGLECLVMLCLLHGHFRMFSPVPIAIGMYNVIMLCNNNCIGWTTTRN